MNTEPGGFALKEPSFGYSTVSKFQANKNEKRFLGYVKLSGSTKMPVVIDLAPGKDAGSSSDMRAVVRMHLGGFDSDEFASFYFPAVRLDSSGRLDFSSSGSAQPSVSMNNTYLEDEQLRGQMILAGKGPGGRTYSGYFRAIGIPGDSARPEGSDTEDPLRQRILALDSGLRTIDELSGEYVGQCNGATNVLQVDFTRLSDGSGTVASPERNGMFGAGAISARLGPGDDRSCGIEGNDCDIRIFKTGTLEPFSGDLVLRSSSGNLECRYENNAVYCDSCMYSRSKKTEALAIQTVHKFQRSEEMFLDSGRMTSLVKDPSSLSGSFYGYLHHETTDRYQPVTLRVDYRADTRTYESIAALYFGDMAQNEFIVYPFDPVVAGGSEKRIILDGPGESYLVLNAIGDKSVSAVWYSKTVGRVGSVVFARNSMPPLMVDRSKLIASLQGTYSGPNWKVDLMVASNISESAADFSSLRIFGSAATLLEPSRRRLIQFGSYDFYSGAIAFMLDDGRIIHGSVSEGGVSLFWPGWPKRGQALDRRQELDFTRVSQPDRTIAARRK